MARDAKNLRHLVRELDVTRIIRAAQFSLADDYPHVLLFRNLNAA
jgi:hypothetical protein